MLNRRGGREHRCAAEDPRTFPSECPWVLQQGYVAQQLAVDLRELVSALILEGAPLSMRGNLRSQMAGILVDPFSGAGPRVNVVVPLAERRSRFRRRKPYPGRTPVRLPLEGFAAGV